MKRKRIDVQWLIISLIGSTLINLIMLPYLAVTADNHLPPRGTPTPVPTATPAAAAAAASVGHDGARLQLHVTYGENWAWNSLAWQDLWTEVEWSNGENWFVVEGWRGNLDGIEQTEQGNWMSQKEWWVGSNDLGTGPFRWVIYEREGGEMLATSSSFDLPAHNGETTVVNETVGE